jgi:hypothetical protein
VGVVVEARLVTGDEAYDRAYYRDLCVRAVASLLMPFGWTEEELAERYAEGRQVRLAAGT